MKKIVLALFLVTAFACKSDKKETKKETPATSVDQVEKESIKITFNAVIPKDDTFSLQFKKEDGKWYPKKGIEVSVIGSDQPQDIVFNLPENTYPTGFLFLVGKNNKENVVLNTASFDFEDNTFFISKENFFQFFNPNRFIDFNKADNSYKLKDEEKARPFFNSRNLLIQRLEEKLY